jgi:hypothetical protein
MVPFPRDRYPPDYSATLRFLMDQGAIEQAVADALGRFTRAIIEPSDAPSEETRRALLIHDHSRGIQAVLEAQPEFATGLLVNFGSGATGFGPYWVASTLLREAANRGSGAAAVAWLQKVLSTTSATGLAVYTMHGVQVQSAVHITENVLLTPFDSLPDSRQKQALVERSEQLPHVGQSVFATQIPSGALVAYLEISPFLFKPTQGPLPPNDHVSSLQQTFEDIRHCLAVTYGNPILPGVSWFQFADRDLDCAIGMITTTRHQEVVPLFLNGQIVVDANQTLDEVRAFLSLPTDVQRRARTANERVHLALIRWSPADRMVEVAIALETLLVNSPGENTFKVSLRSALLASDGLQSRALDRATISAAYGLRSALMHGGASPSLCKVHGKGELPAAEVADRAVEIARAVIRRILFDGRIPDWSALELSGRI